MQSSRFYKSPCSVKKWRLNYCWEAERKLTKGPFPFLCCCKQMIPKASLFLSEKHQLSGNNQGLVQVVLSFKKGSRDKKTSRGKKKITNQNPNPQTTINFSNWTDNREATPKSLFQFTSPLCKNFTVPHGWGSTSHLEQGAGSTSCRGNARSREVSPSVSNSLSPSQTHLGTHSLWWFMTPLYLTSTKRMKMSFTTA